MISHCLNLSSSSITSFRLDSGSVSVIDLPDGPEGRAVVRCVNYTAHLGRWSVPITKPTLADEDF
jgi:probable phosphoglycerate mutase